MPFHLKGFAAFAGIIAVLFLSFSCTNRTIPSGQADTQTKDPGQTTRGISPKEILSNQPDFRADQSYFMFESRKHGGFGVTDKLAKMGSNYRWESFDNVTFFRLNMPAVLCSASGTVCREKVNYEDCCGYLKANQVENYAKTTDVSFELVGSEVVDGHDCVKIKLYDDAKKETIYFYAASDLRNLVIKTEIVQSDRKHTFMLNNVSFEVPAELFRPIEEVDQLDPPELGARSLFSKASLVG